MSQFEIDVSQINPLEFGQGLMSQEKVNAAEAEEQTQQQVQAGLADQAQQKDAAYESGGRTIQNNLLVMMVL